MPTETKFVQQGGYTLVDFYKDWRHSPRKNGELVLQPLPFVLRDIRRGRFVNQYPPGDSPSVTVRLQGYEFAKKQAKAQAYGRLRGKLYDGNAALGVTFGTLRQSRDMIEKRVATLRTETTQLYADAFRAKRAGRDASGLILETFFGWVPLYKDIHASVNTVIQEADRLTYVRGAGRGYYNFNTQFNRPYNGGSERCDGDFTVIYATRVRIENPNRWLAERAGLLNYGAVAWDLVPWSFLVNAFSNTGSLVNSLTDFAGLSFDGLNETSKNRGVQSLTRWEKDFINGKLTKFECDYVIKHQSRSIIGSLPSPPLIYRIPELDLSTALIGVSLVVQNITRIKPLMKLAQTSVSQLRTKLNLVEYTH